MKVTHYFLGNQLIASSPKPYPWDDNKPCHANVVMICPVCGEAWGRVVRGERQWTPVTRCCTRHSNWQKDSGSFIASWVRNFDWVPKELLIHEFKSAIRNYNDGNN
jgi:hypothetical protein